MPFILIKYYIFPFHRTFQIGLFFFTLFFASVIYGAQIENQPTEIYHKNKIKHKYSHTEKEGAGDNSDIFGMPLEELMDVEVDVASLFTEEDLVAGSSVSVISSEKWKRMGARRIHEVLNNETAVMTYPHYGHYSLVIRGYTNAYSYKGISTLIDGVPLNDLSNGTALYHLPSWELGTLDRVELIKGPGSAIYGSDAFHGVFSMTSFESNEDTCIAEGAGGYPLYGDTNIKMSKGFDDNSIRIDTTASFSGQDSLDMAYDYNDNGVTGTGTREYKYNSKAGIFKIRSTPNEKLQLKAGIYTTSWSGDGFPGLGSKYEGIRDKDLFSTNSRFHMGTGSIAYTLGNDISVETNGYYWQSYYDGELFTNQNTYMYAHLKNNRSGVKVVFKQAENILNIQWFLGYSYDRQEIESSSRDYRTEDGRVLLDLGEQPASGWSREVSSMRGQLKWGMANDKILFLFGGRVDNYIDYKTQFTPRCGLIYLPTGNSSIKALYGRAFMAPDAQNHFGSEGFLKGNPDLEPEIIDAYELLYMYRISDWRFSLNGFYSLWKDGVTLSSKDPITNILIQTNEGKNASIGGEMNLFYAMAPFAVELGLSYVHSKAIDSIDITTLEREDREYEAFPEYMIDLGLFYKLKPMDIDFYINHRIYLHMQASAGFNDPDPDFINDYYRIDCNISKKFDKKWEAILDIRNVLNRKNNIPGIDPNVNGYEEPGISAVLRMTYTFI